jgi:hypothetical protein
MTNNNMWFNKQCIYQKIIKNYVIVRVSGNNIPAKKSSTLATATRIKN